MDKQEIRQALEWLNDDDFVEVVKSAAWKRGRTRTGCDAVGTLIGEMLDDAVNGSDADTTNAIYTVFRVAHRTIQQNIMRVFVNLATLWVREVNDKPSDWVDARNEDSFEVAKSIADTHLVHL